MRRYRPVWALGHAAALLTWDAETHMPSEGIEERSMAIAKLSMLKQRLLLDSKLVELVDRASGLESLNDYERGVVRVVAREIRIYRRLPPSLVVEFTRTVQRAKALWRAARSRGDWGSFKPCLKRLFELSREMAEYLGYDEHPYDALIDLFEEGVRVRDAERIFGYLVPRLRRILEKVFSRDGYPREHPLEKVRLPAGRADVLARAVLSMLGTPWGRVRVDQTSRSFMIRVGMRDVRIGLGFAKRDLRGVVLSAMHEFGHALYELQIDERLIATPLARGASNALHESQSLFWENVVGRSASFIEALYPIASAMLREVRSAGPEELYRYFNVVRPGALRVEADEVTRDLHIYMRYVIEKLMVEGSVGIDDVPELWNEYSEKLLGVRPRSFSEGVLQDVHWAAGFIGYFPTYTMGSVLAAQIAAHVRREIPELPDQVRRRRFAQLKGWLRERIHRWGATYPPKELVKRSLGEDIEPRYLIEYLEAKYLRHTRVL